MSNQRPTVGRIAWRDLMSTDPKASIAFYSELFGWGTKEMDMGPAGKYTMFGIGDKQFGGIMPLPASAGAPSHWIAYISVDDVDAAASRAVEMGGKVIHKAEDIPGVGRFAIIADAQGAVTAPFKSANGPAPEDTGMPSAGMYCWQELMSADPAAAVKFYSSIYGWTTSQMDMGPLGQYNVLHRGDAMTGGIMGIPPGAPPVSFWVGYVAVDDVDASAARAEKLGAKILAPPFDVPGMGRGAMFADPTGAVISIFRGATA